MIAPSVQNLWKSDSRRRIHLLFQQLRFSPEIEPSSRKLHVRAALLAPGGGSS
jgi:hypothetical protein